MAGKDDEKKVVGGLMRLGGTRALASHANDSPFESRTADYVNQANREIVGQWHQGNHAQAMGTATRGVVGATGRALGEGLEGALYHTVFPAAETVGRAYDAVSDGIKGFGRGLFDLSDKKQPENRAASANQPLKSVDKPLDKQAVVSHGLGLANRASGRSFEQNLADVKQAQEQDLPRGGAAQSVAAPVVGGLDAALPDFGRKPAGGFVGSFDAVDDSERKRLLAAALTPHKGAQHGQLTANQLNLARGLYEGEQRNQLEAQKLQEQLAAQAAANEANHANALQREWLQQQGGLRRDALGQAAALQRDGLAGAREQAKLAESARQFDVRTAFEARKNALDTAKAEREESLLARTDALREQLLRAKDDASKAEISRQLAILSGQGEPKAGGFDKDAYIKLQRHVVGADGLPTAQDDVVDLRTGKSILQDAQTGVQVGMVQGGYRFKGGNPNDKKNWEKV